jgi:ribonucleoside-diphosphate reductase alpha chain
MKKIDNKIVGQKVVDKSGLQFHESALHAVYPEEVANELIKEIDAGITSASEHFENYRRPKRIGNTWRLKPPYAEHALYVTFEAIVYNGKKHPYEVFFHGKDISHRQWTDTLTLSWSDTFRKSIEFGFNLNSLVSNIQDTNSVEGGYRVVLVEGEKPIYVNGLVSEIGFIMERFITECYAENYSNSSHEVPPTAEEKIAVGSKCNKCGEYAVINEGGCLTCTSCGDSKCD